MRIWKRRVWLISYCQSVYLIYVKKEKLEVFLNTRLYLTYEWHEKKIIYVC